MLKWNNVVFCVKIFMVRQFTAVYLKAVNCLQTNVTNKNVFKIACIYK